MNVINSLPVVNFNWSVSTVLRLVVITGALVGGVSSTALAETANSEVLFQNAQSGDGTSDPFSGRGNGQMNSVFDLIHQVTLGPDRTSSEFQQDQNQSINSEAQEFRTRQLQLLQPQAQPTPPATPTQN